MGIYNTELDSLEAIASLNVLSTNSAILSFVLHEFCAAVEHKITGLP